MMKKTILAFLFTIILACLMITSVQAGAIRTSDSLRNEEIHDYFFSTTQSGLVTIEIFETIEDETDFDPEINLFVNDGLLDLGDFIENDDDDGSDYSGFGSYISRILGVGDYLLRVGYSNFGDDNGTDSSIIGLTNPTLVY